MPLCEEVHAKFASSTKTIRVSFVGELETGELISTVSSITEQVTSDLTINNISISTVELTISGQKVPAGQAVIFSVSGGVVAEGDDAMSYRIRVAVATAASPPQTPKLDFILCVVDG